MASAVDPRIGVVGLGYVGLPLAVEFGKHFQVVGFDINEGRIAELQAGHDRTLEVSDEELAAAARLSYTADPTGIKDCTVVIVTTPTPLDQHKNPDLSPVLAASRTIGSVLKQGDVVVYESTLYPGATEESACRSWRSCPG